MPPSPISKRWFARWVCWQIDIQASDNDPRRTFWQFKQEATGSAKRGWKMKRLWVEGKPVPRAQMRFDGIPQPKDSIPKQDRRGGAAGLLPGEFRGGPGPAVPRGRGTRGGVPGVGAL